MTGKHLQRGPDWMTILVVVIIFALALAAFLYIRPDTPTVQASTTVDDRTAIEAAELGATLDKCRGLNATVQSVATRLDHQFHLHHEAHRAMVAGKISEEERNKIWTTTLANRVELSALLGEAITAAKKGKCV
jgi:predicted outer membrane protein